MIKTLVPIILIISVLVVSGCSTGSGNTTVTNEVDIKTRVGVEITSYCAKTKLPPPCESGEPTVTVEPSPTKTSDVVQTASPTPTGESDQATKTTIAEFWPAGDLWAKFTLDGDDQEFTKIFLKYGSGDGVFLIYDPIPQGYETDIGRDFVLTTTQGKTYRLRTSGPGFTGKSVTLTDQYGTTYKAELQRAGDGVPPCHTPYSGTLKMDGESYSILYKDSGCISDSGFSTSDQLRIGEAKTGPIKYHLKNNIQIELSPNSKLKDGPFTTLPTEPIVFYVKSGDRVLFEVGFKIGTYGDLGVLNVVDKDTSDNFERVDHEFIVGGYKIEMSQSLAKGNNVEAHDGNSNWVPLGPGGLPL